VKKFESYKVEMKVLKLTVADKARVQRFAEQLTKLVLDSLLKLL